MDSLQFWQHPPRVRLAVVMPRTSKRGIKLYNHAHAFHEIGFLLEGDCDWHMGGKRERLHAGELLLVPAGVTHYEKTAGRARARIGWIGFDFTDGYADVPALLRTPLSAGDYASEFHRLLDVVCAEQQGDAPGHAERAECALREILILLCRLSPAGTLGKTRGATKTLRAPRLMHSAALTLSGNLAQPMRIRDLAHYHSLSASHFALLFRKHQGETPRQFLQNARLARAKMLLMEGGLTVKEIASACGYVDAAHFCHAFKAATKLTPKMFRKTKAPK
ncbi:MAG: AraC family transcriptional regulator [Rariglobus sp.]|jgi:AraC-like DNA-binding protein|nr:AraC family transcriptional regulator [Rariglobus sp.]